MWIKVKNHRAGTGPTGGKSTCVRGVAGAPRRPALPSPAVTAALCASGYNNWQQRRRRTRLHDNPTVNDRGVYTGKVKTTCGNRREVQCLWWSSLCGAWRIGMQAGSGGGPLRKQWQWRSCPVHSSPSSAVAVLWTYRFGPVTRLCISAAVFKYGRVTAAADMLGSPWRTERPCTPPSSRCSASYASSSVPSRSACPCGVTSNPPQVRAPLVRSNKCPTIHPHPIPVIHLAFPNYPLHCLFQRWKLAAPTPIHVCRVPAPPYPPP